MSTPILVNCLCVPEAQSTRAIVVTVRAKEYIENVLPRYEDGEDEHAPPPFVTLNSQGELDESGEVHIVFAPDDLDNLKSEFEHWGIDYHKVELRQYNSDHEVLVKDDEDEETGQPQGAEGNEG